jgi:hypothetical protein
MTNTCMCKRGFFMLRDCGNPAERPCQTCARPVCREHLSPRSGMVTCVECEGRAEQQTKNYADDPGWAYGYRHRYYSQHDYTPLYWGTSSGRYYDDYDYRSFDRAATDEVVEGDAGGAGAGGEFYES